MNTPENAYPVNITVDQARSIIDGELPTELVEAIDNAQGEVFSGQETVSYVLIRIQS